MNRNEPNPYADIIGLPHHVSQRHPQMPMEKRAAQFSPFAAVTGHDEAITETARFTEEETELDENTKAILDARLQEIQEKLGEKPEAAFTWFQPDRKKDGGSYMVSTGAVRKIDAFSRRIVLLDGQEILIDNIRWIEIS